MYGHPPFDLFEAIYTTRSMRRLKPDPVPPALIVKVIEAATMGPSGSNRQPWIFLVVREPEMKEFVAVRYRAAWERYFTPAAREIVAKDPASPQGRILRSAKYLAEHVGEAPVLIFACVKRYNDRLRAGNRCRMRCSLRSRTYVSRRAAMASAPRSRPAYDVRG